MQNYELLIDRISKQSGLEKEEINKKVEAKKAKLSGLISKEGAAQIIAAELGVNFENQELKLSELLPGMRKVNVVGKIIQLFPVREYEKKTVKGKVVNFILADETGNCRCVLWDVNHIELIENGTVKEGDSVEIRNGSMRGEEIHLSGFSEFKKVDKAFENIVVEKCVQSGDLKDIRAGQELEFRAVVVSMYPLRFYSTCPTCNKKVNPEGEDFVCAEHGKVTPGKRAILNLVMDDGTENVRVTFFSNVIGSLVDSEGLDDEVKQEAFRKDLLGTELIIKGRVNKNQLFGNLEVVANEAKKVDLDSLIEDLQKE